MPQIANLEVQYRSADEYAVSTAIIFKSAQSYQTLQRETDFKQKRHVANPKRNHFLYSRPVCLNSPCQTQFTVVSKDGSNLEQFNCFAMNKKRKLLINDSSLTMTLKIWLVEPNK